MLEEQTKHAANVQAGESEARARAEQSRGLEAKVAELTAQLAEVSEARARADGEKVAAVRAAVADAMEQAREEKAAAVKAPHAARPWSRAFLAELAPTPTRQAAVADALSNVAASARKVEIVVPPESPQKRDISLFSPSRSWRSSEDPEGKPGDSAPDTTRAIQESMLRVREERIAAAPIA